MQLASKVLSSISHLPIQMLLFLILLRALPTSP